MNVGSSILKHTTQKTAPAFSTIKFLPMLTLNKSAKDPTFPQLK